MSPEALSTDRAKRDFSRADEPAGAATTVVHDTLAFIILKHDASRLHFDLRLECDGVMKSWMVPKGQATIRR